jgi:hypothetical protein
MLAACGGGSDENAAVNSNIDKQTLASNGVDHLQETVFPYNFDIGVEILRMSLIKIHDTSESFINHFSALAKIIAPDNIPMRALCEKTAELYGNLELNNGESVHVPLIPNGDCNSLIVEDFIFASSDYQNIVLSITDGFTVYAMAMMIPIEPTSGPEATDPSPTGNLPHTH